MATSDISYLKYITSLQNLTKGEDIGVKDYEFSRPEHSDLDRPMKSYNPEPKITHPQVYNSPDYLLFLAVIAVIIAVLLILCQCQFYLNAKDTSEARTGHNRPRRNSDSKKQKGKKKGLVSDDMEMASMNRSKQAS
jgi:hypothetical protein